MSSTRRGISRGAGPVPRRGIFASDAGQGRADEFVHGRRSVAGGPVLVVNRGDPCAEGGDWIDPLPCFGPSVGHIDKVSGNNYRVC